MSVYKAAVFTERTRNRDISVTRSNKTVNSDIFGGK